eukprot:UN14365
MDGNFGMDEAASSISLYGDLTITIHKVINIPKCIGRLQELNRADPFVSIKVNNGEKEY